MDEKLKLNVKMNIVIAKTEFWIRVTKLCSKLHNFVLRKTTEEQSKEFDILREMLKADYSEEYKNNIREVLKMKEDLA